ncbi:MAG: hypothetical protein WC602_00695 [archaeon]
MKVSDLVRRVQALPSNQFQRQAPSKFVLELGRKLAARNSLPSLARLVKVEEKFIDASIASTEIWRPGQKVWVERQ